MRRTVAGFLAAAAVLVGFLLAVDPAGVWSELAAADPLLFAVGFPSVLLALVCWSEAYRRLFAAAGADLAAGSGFVVHGTGTFAKQVVPMGHVGGPAIVAYAYDRAVSLGYDRSMAVVTLGEAVTLLASVSLGVVGVVPIVAGTASVAERRLLVVATALVAASLLAALFVVGYRRRTVEAAVRGFARALRLTVGRVSDRVRDAADPERVAGGLARYYRTFDTVAGDRRALLAAFGFMLVGWVLFAVPLYTAALAVGVGLPVFVAFLLVPASGFTTVFPLPGGLGGYEVVLTAAVVALVGVDAAVGAALVLLYRLASYWFLLLVGGLAVAYASTAGTTDGVPPFDHPE